ncbi:MAG: hypothetical protein JWQ58_3068 [Reyranella sp.]|nr:hypothetical protein [Reyranella sp.]
MTESGRKRIYAIIFGLILAGITLAGLEVLASLEAPPWPARVLRSTPPVNVQSTDFTGLADKPWIFEPFNSWGMRDRERSIAKPAGGGFRSVFIGDSYLEFQLTRLTVPGEVERRFIEAGQPNAEMINLGISATGPRSYYYRLRDVGFALSPDAVVVFFFSGNDFLYDGEGYGQGILPPLVDEAPGGSILGNVMPNANWVLVNRLRLSEMLTTNKPIPQEFDNLARIARMSPAERTPAIVQHVKRYYYPGLSEQQIAGIFGRDDGAFWQAYASRTSDDEALQGWILNLMTKAEVEKSPYFDVTTKEQAAGLVKDGDIQATLSWLEGMDRAARERGVPLILFVVPPGSVDPDYAAYWKPWPRFYAFNVIADYRQDKLLEALSKTSIRYFDLRKDFEGVRGAYRRTDAHWTEKGVEIAATRVYKELRKLEKR